MKKVVLRAPLLSKSGYGVHSRQVMQYLLGKSNIELKTQCVPWGTTPWYTNTNDCNGLVGEIIKRTSADPKEKFDVSLQVILPNEWDTSPADYNIGITAGVETDKCNPLWTAVHCNKMDKVIVPSQHTKKTLLDSGASSTPIHVIPEAYFPELLEEDTEIDLELTTDFNFLTVGVMTGNSPENDRKNLFYLIKWFVEEFKEDSSVGLVIKTNRGRESTIDRSNTFSLLENVLKQLGHTGSPKVYLLHGNMTRKEMNALYRHPKIKGLISATRGEGFGLPLLEAAVAGLPVLATNWSAHIEFLNKGKWPKIEYELTPVHASKIDGNIFVEGSKWAEVSEVSLKKVLRKFYKSSHTPKDWAESLSEKLRESHSITSIIKQYDKVLSEVLD